MGAGTRCWKATETLESDEQTIPYKRSTDIQVTFVCYHNVIDDDRVKNHFVIIKYCSFLRWLGCWSITSSLEDTIHLIHPKKAPVNVRTTFTKGSTAWKMFQMWLQKISLRTWSLEIQRRDLLWRNVWIIPSSGPVKGKRMEAHFPS